MENGFPSQQPSALRKLVHLAATIVPASGWFISYWLAIGLAGAALAASVVLEASRRWWPWVNRWLWRLFPTIFRAWEDRRLLGSTWFAIGMLSTLVLYGRDVGGTALLFLAWGDPAAEVVGCALGKPGQRKTLAGSLGCLAVCLIASAVGIYLGGLQPLPAVGGAVVATLVERWSPPPDDNLWIPLLSGLAIMLGQRLVTSTL